MNDRDHFAAAALTGLIASQPTLSAPNICRMSFNWADLMLRERERTSVGVTGMDPVTERKSAATHGACASPCSQPFDSAPITLDAYRRFFGEVMSWISEATGFLQDDALRTDDGRDLIINACAQCWDAFDRIAYPTIHDAAPAARADLPDERPPNAVSASGGTPSAASRDGSGTGDTPATHATRGEGSEQREGTEPVAWGAVPVAWAAVARNGQPLLLAYSRADAEGAVAGMADVVPLYRHPPCQDVSQKNLTLTDAEREAVARAADWLHRWQETHGYHSSESGDLATLRGLLERMGGGE